MQNNRTHCLTNTATFIGLSPLEARYFRMLVDYARAETIDLREAIQSELNDLRERARSTKERLNLKQVLDPLAESEYYASWQISAVHLALTIPSLQSREKLAKALHLPLERINEIINILIRCQIVAKKSGRLRVVKQLMHGDHRSPSARRHLINWRHKAIDAVQFFEANNFHYSAAVSVSHNDFQKIRELLTACLARAVDIIKLSPEEKVAVINLDWFTIT